MIPLLTFMPFAFGAVEAWSEEVVIALAAAISIIFAEKLVFDSNAQLVWSWTYIPVGLFILVGIFQLVPLPQGAVAVSPNTADESKRIVALLSKRARENKPHL